ncbi:unnamed protein product [Dovyalis caffra]|uniref:Uncharacterized protein n=1 Tax=Dovyalis caffra TaxID=77055 RepID=A0AAV1R9C5_9ROSI|nr:unnamed protein product [Dovyalis caffra]
MIVRQQSNTDNPHCKWSQSPWPPHLSAALSSVASLRSLPAVASAARGTEVENVKLNRDMKKEGSNGRRDLTYAAAVCSVAGIAVAEELGNPEAKKLYAPCCITMPTTNICRN